MPSSAFRPELMARSCAADDAPAETHRLQRAARQAADGLLDARDAKSRPGWLWIAGASYDVVFDLGSEAIAKLAGVATPIRELDGWSYRHSRDLTGFEDGTKNPALMIAPSRMRRIPDGQPRSRRQRCWLFQKWQHQTAAAWEAIGDAAQERSDRADASPTASKFPEGDDARRLARLAARPSTSTARSARSSAATRRTATSRRTAPCSSASAPTRSGWI